MVSVLASCAVDREFEPRLGQTKVYVPHVQPSKIVLLDYEIIIKLFQWVIALLTPTQQFFSYIMARTS
jgi:hypothetical protein